MSTAPNVPIGPTTVVGYGGTVVGLIAALLSMIFPDGDEQTIALIASSLFTLGSFLVTQIGRYIQAKEAAKGKSAVDVIKAQRASLPTMAAGSSGRNIVAQRSAFMAGVDTGLTAAEITPDDPDRPRDPAAEIVGDEDLPSDEEEAAAPPPADDTVVPDNPDNGER